jgi:hypothetical protein
MMTGYSQWYWTLVLTEVFEVAQDVLPFLRDLLPGITSSTQRFLVMLLQRQALRLADDLEAASIKKGASTLHYNNLHKAIACTRTLWRHAPHRRW